MSVREGRLEGADSVKGIATLLVLLTHYAWTDQERLAFLFPFWVQVAVPAFMFVTGLVGAASMERARARGDGWQVSWVVRRLVAWVTPLLVLCALEAVCYALRGEPFPYRIDRILLDGKAGPGGYYYLVLAQLALLLPLMYRTIADRPSAGLVVWLLVDILFEFLCKRWEIGDPAYRVLAGRYLFSVACGCHAWVTRERRLRPCAAALSMGLGLAFITATKYLCYWPQLVKAWYATSWAAALWSLPALRWACLRWKGTRPLSELGRHSFSVFTAQVFFYRLLDDHVYAAIDSRAMQLVVCVTSCLVLGLLYEKVIGKRIADMSRSVSERMARVDPAPLEKRMGDLFLTEKGSRDDHNGS